MVRSRLCLVNASSRLRQRFEFKLPRIRRFKLRDGLLSPRGKHELSLTPLKRLLPLGRLGASRAHFLIGSPGKGQKQHTRGDPKVAGAWSEAEPPVYIPRGWRSGRSARSVVVLEFSKPTALRLPNPCQLLTANCSLSDRRASHPSSPFADPPAPLTL